MTTRWYLVPHKIVVVYFLIHDAISFHQVTCSWGWDGTPDHNTTPSVLNCWNCHFDIFSPPSFKHTLFTCCQTVLTWTHQSTTLYTNLCLSISCFLLQISGVSLYSSLSVMVSLLLLCQQVLLVPVSDKVAVAALVIAMLISSHSSCEVFLRSLRLRILRCFTCLFWKFLCGQKCTLQSLDCNSSLWLCAGISSQHQKGPLFKPLLTCYLLLHLSHVQKSTCASRLLLETLDLY